MEPLNLPLSFSQLKQAKKYTDKALKELGIELSSSTTGNLVANMFGYKNWNVAKSATEFMSPVLSPIPLMSRLGQLPTLSYSAIATSNHNITFETMFPKKSKEFTKAVGYFESVGHNEFDANDIVAIASEYGILDEHLDYMSKDETIACLTHVWHCKVLELLDEDKKSFETRFFCEYLDVHQLGGPNEKALERYLQAIRTAKNDLDTFKPFLRQLGLEQADVEVAIERYFASVKKE